MSDSPHTVVALGSPTGEHRASIEAAVRHASAELSITRDPQKALAEVKSDSTLAVLVDMAVLGAENFCRKARASEQLRRTPIIGLSRNPGELSFNRVFAWGADDLVPLGQERSLSRRLLALAEKGAVPEESFGQAVVAEPNPERCTMLGRVLTQAGYSVKYAIDATSAEYYATQFETRLVILNSALIPPRKLIETVELSGALPMWVVISEQRSLAKVVQSLNGIARVAVTASGGSPEDVLFVANELVFSRGNKRSEWRALFGTPVCFREIGTEQEEFGFTYDISPSGIYIRSLLPSDFSEVAIELRPPRTDKVVSLCGRVVRRFRFGSGSIASAPPGFGIKLENSDEEALATWVRACEDFLKAPAPVATKPTPGPGKLAATPAAPAARPLPQTLRVQTEAPPAPAAPAAKAAAAPAAPALAPDEVDEVLGSLGEGVEPAGRQAQHSDVGLMLAEALESQDVTASSGALPVSMNFAEGAVFEKPPSSRPTDQPVLATARALPSAKATLIGGGIPTVQAPPTLATPAVQAKPVAAAKPAADAKPVVEAKAAASATPAFSPADAFLTTQLSPVQVPPPARAAAAPTPPPTVEVVTLPTPAATPAPTPAAPAVEPPPESKRKTTPPPPPQGGQPTALPAASWAAIAPAPSAPPAGLAAEKSSSRTPLVIAGVLLLGALGGVGAFLVSSKHAPQPAVLLEPSAAPVEAPVASAGAPEPTDPPAVSAPAPAEPSPSVSAAPALSASAAPALSASAEPAPSVSAAPALSASAPAAPPAAPDSVDLTALRPNQGYLYVRSSATARVFVFANDVGETNTPIAVGCGTKFVRLGHKLGDFIEPGNAVIIKCGVLNEIAREPR